MFLLTLSKKDKRYIQGYNHMVGQYFTSKYRKIIGQKHNNIVELFSKFSFHALYQNFFCRRASLYFPC